jgi:MFS transporter, UMF1 family
VADNPVDGAVQWSYSVTAAALAVVLGAPALGAIADGLGRRKPWLLVFTALTVAGTLSLWLVKPSPSYILMGQVLYAATATSFGFAMVFYDAMLRSITPPGYIGRVSGWGWALGYGGGLASLVLALVLLVNADPPPFGLARESYEHVRATSVLAALWFALFAIPLFLFTPDRPPTGTSVRNAVQTGLLSLTTTMRQLLANRAIARFLLASMFYTNGLNTLFAFGGIYAAGTFQMSFTEVLTFGIALNVTAGLGAAGFAWVDDLIGSKRTVLIALAALSVLGLALVLVETRSVFFALGCLLGIFVGPAQAAGRALMARLAPKELETEAFGLYELAGTVTVFAGPLVWGVATDLFHSQRVGMSTILFFLVAGMIILLPLREPR